MIDSEIKQQRDVIKHIQNAVLLVDYLLRHSLNAKQRLIIKRFYISEQTWREIAHTYEQKYRVNYISRVRLKQIQKQALDKMLENIDKAHKQLI
jgi:DNA-directed RNA polymerase specialized sigma subunit